MSASSSAGASGAQGAALTSGSVKSVSIVDPILNRTAYTLSIPSNWHFDGTVVQGTPCATGPFPVFRAESPNGLMGIKMLPRLDWAWSEGGSQFAPQYHGGTCADYKSEVPASDVLQHMIDIVQAGFLRDDINPNAENFKRNVASHNSASFTMRGDVARAWDHYKIHNIEIEERMDFNVTCSVNTVILIGRQHSCSAYIVRAWAPKGRWDENAVDAVNKSIVIDQDWNREWYGHVQQVIAQMQKDGMDRVMSIAAAGQQQRNAMAAEFQQAQQERFQENQDFIHNLQANGEHFRAQQQAQSDNRAKVADDWCDVALNLQKRRDPNTGAISKDSALYNYSWVNSSGSHFESNDINDNPNNIGDQSWQLQDNVRAGQY